MVRVVPYGEADTVVTLFTEAFGKISALARGVRRGGRRAAGGLDPMHTLSMILSERPGAELFGLSETSIAKPRLHLTSNLGKMEAAGHALRWVRSGSPVRTPEPSVWSEINGLLDRLDDPTNEAGPATHLAATGLRLLAAFGYGLELSACVRCGKPCEPGRPAYVDARRGGLVCRSCGGGGMLLDAGLRSRLSLSSRDRENDAFLEAADARTAQLLVEEAFAAHAFVVS